MQLQKAGIKGDQKKLKEVAKDFDCDPLTLDLLAAYLKRWYAGRLNGLFANVVWNHNRDASLLHLAAGGELSDVLAVNLSVQNLLNVEFIPTMSMLRELNIAEPGRNVRVQLVWKF